MWKALSILDTSAGNPDRLSKFMKKVQYCKGWDKQLLTCKFFIIFQLQPYASKRISAGKLAWLISGATNININSADCCRNNAVGKGGVIHIG